MTLSKKQKENAIKENKRHDTDTGSPEVQVALLSKKIDTLSKHLKKHRKDKHSRRGLLGMVESRRKHLNYLKQKDPKQHADVLKQIKG